MPALLPSSQETRTPVVLADAVKVVPADSTRPVATLSTRGFSSALPWRTMALGSAVFVMLVALGMFWGYQRKRAEDPLRAGNLVALREKLHAAPNDPALVRQIREIDQAERQRYFTSVQRNKWGAWLLIAGSVSLLISASNCFVARRPTPASSRALATAEALQRTSLETSLAIGIGGLAVVMTMILVAFTLRPSGMLPGGSDGAEAVQAAARRTVPVPPESWPRFRGADGSGYSARANLPLTWNAATGDHVAWKSRVPLGGFNSPVTVGDRIFCTGSTGSLREVYCFGLNDGALQWRLPITLLSKEAVMKMAIPSLTGAAAATVAADGERVYAIFATGELVAADHAGRLVWSKSLGQPDNTYGHATSLLLGGERLILQLDQGDAASGKSKIYAFERATGTVAWEQRRNVGSAWTTPIVIQSAGREQIICLGEPWLISYEPARGEELWRFDGFGGELTPSPIFAGGYVLAINPNQKLFAIRPDGRGDVTKTHQAWALEANVPDITSPVSNGELLFTLETSGGLACFEVATGKKLWEHAYEGEFHASPAIAGDRLYLITKEGAGFAVRVAREFQELGRSSLGEAVVACPAVAGDRLVIRGATNLFCLANVTGSPGVASVNAEGSKP